jgi:CBS domain-containing protein
MRMHQLRRLPVVDAQGQLVGMLTLMDLARRAGKGGLPVARVHEILTQVGAARTSSSASEPIREVKAAAKPAPKAKASSVRATKTAKKSSSGSRRALVKQR